MSSPDLLERTGTGDAAERVETGRAMATRVTLRIAGRETGDAESVDASIRAALGVFSEVDRTCTRFDATSDLMRANRAPNRWHRVPPTLLRALAEAKAAYDATGGRFDPRVLRDLAALGYDRTLPFAERSVELEGTSPRPRPPMRAWHPRLRGERGEVLLGEDPVDLGGIGKGLAVRWASEALVEAVPNHLVEAGGDVYCSGTGPDGDAWRVGVEDPFSPGEHVSVLALSNLAVATSSIRLRRWSRGGTRVHHLIDPATGLPGGQGLVSVTVVAADPARAEVWSKSLFIAGLPGIARLAADRELCATWVREDGEVSSSEAMAPHVRWTQR